MNTEVRPRQAPNRWSTRAFAAAFATVFASGVLAQDDTEVDNIYRLTEAEQSGLVQQIGACWFVDPSFRNVTVRVSFSLTLDGEVIDNFVELEDARGGDDTGQAAAYEAARTAIIRCEGRGYHLPEEKYETWRDLEMSFVGRNGTPRDE